MSPQNAHQKVEHNPSSKGYDRSWKAGLHGLSLAHLSHRPVLFLAIVTHPNIYTYIAWVLPFQMWRRVDSSITTNVSEECVASVFRTEQYNYIVRHLDKRYDWYQQNTWIKETIRMRLVKIAYKLALNLNFHKKKLWRPRRTWLTGHVASMTKCIQNFDPSKKKQSRRIKKDNSTVLKAKRVIRCELD